MSDSSDPRFKKFSSTVELYDEIRKYDSRLNTELVNLMRAPKQQEVVTVRQEFYEDWQSRAYS